MKRHVLILLALLSFAPAMAQTPPAAEPGPSAAASPAPDTAAELLATLSEGQTLDDLAPAPLFLTGCTSDSQCPTGQLCCYMCGAQPDGDDSHCRRCVTPFKGRCPLVV
jgi:hypothetical protein